MNASLAARRSEKGQVNKHMTDHKQQSGQSVRRGSGAHTDRRDETRDKRARHFIVSC